MKISNGVKKQSGSGLIFAIVLLFVILGMVVTLSSVTVLETKMNQKTKSSVGAFYNSESGVEWALNKIATGTGPNISNIFGSSFSGGVVTCPSGFGCQLYLLDSQGKVLTADTTIDQVKAVRSIGTQNVGGTADTSRAIEAAVASGGTCFENFCTTNATSGGQLCSAGHCPSGFTEKINAGSWGWCKPSAGNNWAHYVPPGGGCIGGGANGNSYQELGQAYLCCQ